MPISNPIAFYDQAVKYTPVVPRILELNSVAVPTTGQVYQLTGVPSDRPIIAVLQLHPGFAPDSTARLAVICESVVSGGSQSIPSNTPGGLADAMSFYGVAANLGLYAQRSIVLVATTNGQAFLRRAGSYLSPTHQTYVWTLGCFEGISL